MVQTGLSRPIPNPDRLHISPHETPALIGMVCVLGLLFHLKMRGTGPTGYCGSANRTLGLMDDNDKKLKAMSVNVFPLSWPLCVNFDL